GSTPITELALVDQDVQPGTTYHYLVVAVGAGGATAATEQVPIETPPAVVECAPGEWSAEYFKGRELAGDVVSRECLSAVEKYWGRFSGPAGLGSDNFSARFTKTINQGAGTYEFQVQAD